MESLYRNVNSQEVELEDKIKKIIDLLGGSPTQFADEIGIPRSSVSHILAGRNKPSLDVVTKIIYRYPEFGSTWFLEGQEPLLNELNRGEVTIKSAPNFAPKPSQPVEATLVENKPKSVASDKEIERILIFFKDGTFKEYR